MFISLLLFSAASKLYTRCVPNACASDCSTKRIFKNYIDNLKQNSNINFYSFSFANLSCVDKFINNNTYRTCFFNNDEAECKSMNKIDDSVYLNDYGFHVPINAVMKCRFDNCNPHIW